MRRKISILLAALLLISILPMQTLALESTGPSEEPIPLEPLVLTHINPLYADILEEADLVQAEAAAVSETETVYSEEQAAAVLRSQLKSRTQTIVISYVGTVLADPLKILNAAMDHTGVPTEGDYLLWQYGGANYKREGYISGSTYYLTLTYTMTYYTTAAQERIVDSAAEALLADLDLSQSDDYETVKAIYDWICTNVTYDYKNLSDSSYLRKHTAYAALVDRTAVCQGYALLLYRLLLTEGIDTRIISGKAGGAHGWNIIELDGKYYNADSTWDAGKTSYTYFLQNAEGFSDHTRDSQYDTAQFHAEYPMAEKDYVPVHKHSYGAWSQTKAPSCTEEGTETRRCTCGTEQIRTVSALEHEFAYIFHVESGTHTIQCTRGDYEETGNCTFDEGEITVKPSTGAAGVKTYTCTVCGGTYDQQIEPSESTVTRVYGSDRCGTAIEAAQMLMQVNGMEAFDTILVASGDNFPDALSGSYLADVTGAPILLVRTGNWTAVLEYIRSNLSPNGTVYILGGTVAVSEKFAQELESYGIRFERLYGSSRYTTNLRILEKAEQLREEKGLEPSNLLLVCTGTGYADSLSASATGLPILLVNGTAAALTAEQQAYLEGRTNTAIYIIGGNGAVSGELETALGAYGTVRRIYGATREETSVKVAETFFDSPDLAVLTYSRNFPDGLSGGPLACSMGAPLLLTNTGYENLAAEYLMEKGIKTGIVLGGTAAVSDAVVRNIFGEGTVIQ